MSKICRRMLWTSRSRSKRASADSPASSSASIAARWAFSAASSARSASRVPSPRRWSSVWMPRYVPSERVVGEDPPEAGLDEVVEPLVERSGFGGRLRAGQDDVLECLRHALGRRREPCSAADLGERRLDDIGRAIDVCRRDPVMRRGPDLAVRVAVEPDAPRLRRGEERRPGPRRPGTGRSSSVTRAGSSGSSPRRAGRCRPGDRTPGMRRQQLGQPAGVGVVIRQPRRSCPRRRRAARPARRPRGRPTGASRRRAASGRDGPGR